MRRPETSRVSFRLEAVCLAVGLLLGESLVSGAAAQSSTAAPPSLTAAAARVGVRQLVVPFDNATRDPRGYWLGEASAILLTDDLQALGLTVIGREARQRAFDRLRIPAGAPLTDATVIRAGEVAGAERVVAGTLDLAGGQITVRARVMRLDTGRMFAEVAESGALGDIFDIYARLARKLAPNAGRPGSASDRGWPSTAAFEDYVKGILATGLESRGTYLTQALRISPTFDRARVALWRVRTDQGEFKEALAVVSGVSADAPQARQARFLGAVSMIDLADYGHAQEALMELNSVRSDAGLLTNLGVVQLRRADVSSTGKAAAAWFAEAARRDRDDPDVLFNLGYALWLERDLQGSIAALGDAIRRNPADSAARYVLGAALVATGRITEGSREKDLAARLSPTYVKWEATQAGANAVPRGLERIKTEIDGERASGAAEVLAAGGQRERSEMEHLESGRRLLAADRGQDAIAELRRVVLLAPDHGEAHLLLGRAYLRTGRVEEAIDALTISIWSDDTIAARVALAEAHLQRGNVMAARTELDIIVRRDPENVDAKRLRDRVTSR